MKMDAAGPQYLLVTARRDPTTWVFPKGHVEHGETVEETAQREVREEGGVRAGIIAPLGVLELSDARVAMFLMRYEGDVAPVEDRKIGWYGYEDARRRLAFPESRELIERAHLQVEPQP